MRQLTDNISVSPQIDPSQIAEIKAAGFEVVMSNRPDGEEFGQPLTADIKSAAEAAGMTFIHLPIVSGQFTVEAIADMAIAVDRKKVFAYCRSGTRSAGLWALSQKGNLSADEILEKTSAAGYDFAQLRPYLSE